MIVEPDGDWIGSSRVRSWAGTNFSVDASAPRAVVTTTMTAVFVASSWYSTATFLTSWRDNPAQPYLQNARRSFAIARRASNAPFVDQEVDPLVLGRVAWPENLASHVFALLPDRPEFASATTQLRILDSSGRLADAQVSWVRTIEPGPVPQCGYFVQPDVPVRLGLDGLFEHGPEAFPIRWRGLAA